MNEIFRANLDPDCAIVRHGQISTTKPRHDLFLRFSLRNVKSGQRNGHSEKRTFLFRSVSPTKKSARKKPKLKHQASILETPPFQGASQICEHSEGHPYTEGTLTGTLVNVRDLRRNSGECQGGSREYSGVGSPKFAKLRQLRQSSHEGARMLPVHLGICILVNIKRGFDTGALVKATLPRSSVA